MTADRYGPNLKLRVVAERKRRKSSHSFKRTTVTKFERVLFQPSDSPSGVRQTSIWEIMQ